MIADRAACPLHEHMAIVLDRCVKLQCPYLFVSTGGNGGRWWCSHPSAVPAMAPGRAVQLGFLETLPLFACADGNPA